MPGMRGRARGARTIGSLRIDTAAVQSVVRAIFPRHGSAIVERVEEGVSTIVYKVFLDGAVYYLRVLPEEGASFAPEAHAHTRLRQRGVKVPDIVYFEHFNQALQRSVMVTTAIPGSPVGRLPVGRATREILIDAGRDLAVINQIRVEGFGWIARDREARSGLAAEFAGGRAFALDHLDEDISLLAIYALDRSDIIAMEKVIGRFDAWLDGEEACLAHGDFDVTHIYQEHGRYTGIIDFGEIRGTDAFYDLGHFSMRDGETLPALVLPELLEGYGEVRALPPDHQQRISFAGLLIAVRTLARRLRKSPQRIERDQTVVAIARDLQVLRE